MDIGDRVRLHAPSPLLSLSSDLGTIVRPSEHVDLSYWIVRLDSPASYRHGDDVIELTEVVEMDDNMTPLEPGAMSHD